MTQEVNAGFTFRTKMPMNSEMVEELPGTLRWLCIENGMPDRILQQEFVLTKRVYDHWGNMIDSSQSREWRDVPIVYRP